LLKLKKEISYIDANRVQILKETGMTNEELASQQKKLTESAQKYTDALPEAAAMSGFIGVLDSLNMAFAEGELNAKSFFNAILDGAMRALPSLVTMLGLSNPFAIVGAVAAIAAGITALKSLMANGMVEGGLVTGKKGTDKIPKMLTHYEYVIPADITQKNLPSLERLRYTGQWWNNATISTAGIEQRLDILNQTFKAGHNHDIKVNQKVNFNHTKYSELIRFENSKNNY